MDDKAERKVDDKIFSVVNTGAWSSRISTRFFWAFILLVFILIATQIRTHMVSDRGIEQTLGGIHRDESCKVLETLSMEERQQIRTLTKVHCTKSGEHTLYGAEFPDYFRRDNPHGVRAIPPDEYESKKRLW